MVLILHQKKNWIYYLVSLTYSEGRIIVTCDQGIEKSIVFCEIKPAFNVLEFFVFYVCPFVLVIIVIIVAVIYRKKKSREKA